MHGTPSKASDPLITLSSNGIQPTPETTHKLSLTCYLMKTLTILSQLTQVWSTRAKSLWSPSPCKSFKTLSWMKSWIYQEMRPQYIITSLNRSIATKEIRVIQQWLSETQKVGWGILILQVTVNKIATLCISNINIQLVNSFIRLPKQRIPLPMFHLLK